MILIASTASSFEPLVGMMTRSARLIACATIRLAVPSRSTMTNCVFSAAASTASSNVSSATATTVSLDGGPVSLLHCEIGWLGSASISVTEPPRPASSVASSKAEVDLPAPPLEEARAMVGMAETQISYCFSQKDDCCLSVCQLTTVGHLLSLSRQLADCHLTDDCRQLDDRGEC